MPVINKKIYIDAPLDKVFDLAIDPQRWEQWYAGLSGPIDMESDGKAGSVVDFKYAMAGLHLPIKIKVESLEEEPTQKVWKGKFEGGISGEQTFTYTEKEGGTELEASIDYKVPGKVLGKIANSLVVEKMQEHATEQTLANLKSMMENS